MKYYKAEHLSSEVSQSPPNWTVDLILTVDMTLPEAAEAME